MWHHNRPKCHDYGVLMSDIGNESCILFVICAKPLVTNAP